MAAQSVWLVGHASDECHCHGWIEYTLLCYILQIADRGHWEIEFM